MYSHETGALYIVATPIGNMKDITLRALDILKRVDFVAAEDTRVTRALLDHYGIETPCVSYHDHNKEEKIPVFLHRMHRGESIALVSDQGTPLISDPGSALVGEAVRSGLPVHPVPGASSLLAALQASGLHADHFLFGGFLPRTAGEMRERLLRLQEGAEAGVFFETPNRILKTLTVLEHLLGPERRIAIGREMTKLFETFYRGTIPEVRKLLETSALKGELVLIVEGAPPGQGPEKVALPEVLSCLEGLSATRSEKARFLVRLFGLSREEAYKKSGTAGPE